MVLPAGFALPPLPYLLALGTGVAAVAFVLYDRRPRVTDRVVMGFVPWIIVGSALHVLYQLELSPAVVRPLLGTPAVYLTTFVLAGAIWLVSGDRAPAVRAISGSIAFVVLAGVGLSTRPVRVGWPLAGLIVSRLLGGIVWGGLRRVRPAVRATGWTGGLVLVAHSVDAVSTAIGVDVLGFGERTPASRLVMDIAAMLPTADTFGVGWLFVVVKVGIASLVVWLFVDFVREDPQQARLLLLVIAAVGLGPGVHNLLLYTVS